MKLTILDRLMIMRVLPSESDFSTLRIVKDMKKKLHFTEEEKKEYKIQTVFVPNEGQRITWDKKKNNDLDIKLVKIEREIIIARLEELDKSKKATNKHLELYDKVIAFHTALEIEAKKLEKKKKE